MRQGVRRAMLASIFGIHRKERKVMGKKDKGTKETRKPKKPKA